ncbi:response regulator [Tropicimonas sp.]|uniref:response regulator n=1 Tax=Tropicimonas sp. TaxID=2067044 RepID=UPI003A843318
MKILLVEDDPNLRALWGPIFEEAGHQTFQVATEGSALAALRTSDYDLVVLDLCVAGGDTLGVASYATCRNPDCRVVVVSGSAAHSRAMLSAAAPAVTTTLRKPVDIEDLEDACRIVTRTARRMPVTALIAASAEYRP